MGMRVMIDFHYSDSWADPGKQTKPAAWASHTFAQLLDDVYNHTYEVLDTLKQCGVTPEWAQIGNEIAGGMLWPDGKLWAPGGSSANWPNLSQLLNKGYDAAKAVDSSIKVVIHLESGNDNSKFRWFFDNATSKGVRYDIIGMSYYPYWIGSDYTATINNLGNNLNDMAARYDKDVMVVEVGGIDTQIQNTYDMLLAVIAKTLAVPGNRGLGVIYWEPEGARIWSGYQLSCWRSDGKPTAALNAFLTNTSGLGVLENPSDTNFNLYPNPSKGGMLNFEFNKEKGYRHIKIYDSNGSLQKQENVTGKTDYSMSLDLAPGIYFVNLYTSNNSEIRKLVIW
jgi:arabinogalactan endo-1,4-beta-galactosidase